MKIPLRYEDFVDRNLCKWSADICPLFKAFDFTPNMITTIGLICAIIAIYLAYNKKCYWAAGLFLLAYFFDCVDGCYARKYNMTTEFGDYYDHICDWVRTIPILLLIVYGCICKKTIVPIIVLITLFVLANIKQVYQDKFYNVKSGTNETASLGFLQNIFSTPDDLKELKSGVRRFRYTGWGMFNIMTVIFLATCGDVEINMGSVFEWLVSALKPDEGLLFDD